MKKLSIYLLFLISLCIAGVKAEDKIDITQKPEPLPEKAFVFPNYETVTLKNGLKVFIIESKSQPTTDIRLLIKGGNSVDEKFGIAELLSTMMTKGAGDMSALDIAKKMDGIGADFSASAGADYSAISASCLTKHLQEVLNMYKEVLLSPTFPKDEFDKAIKMMIASIKQQKSNGDAIAASLSRIVTYGPKHPYSQVNREDVLKTINISDLKAYFKKYFIPNNSTLAVVTDLSKGEIVKMLEKTFDKWKQSTPVNINVPKPEPMPLGVYFVKRPGSVQSSVFVTSLAVPYSAQTYDTYRKLDMAAKIMGGGFGGRLFKTLRETYSYTYTPEAYITTSKYANRIADGADVRTSVTDSSVTVILDQLHKLATEPPAENELYRMKRYTSGSYKMSFQNSAVLAYIVQTFDFMDIPIEKAKTYLKSINAISETDVMDAASKYMTPEKSYIVVVGDQSVRDKLTKFGKIYDYDLDLNPLSGESAKMDKVSLTADELVNKYVDAIGGKEKVNAITTISYEGTLHFEAGEMKTDGKITEKTKAPNKQYQTMDLGFAKQASWVNGTECWSNNNGSLTKLEGDQAAEALEDAVFMKETKLTSLGKKCEVLGKQNSNILLKLTGKDGSETIYYFDAETYLINKIESTEKTEQGTIPVTVTFKSYTTVDGVKLPDDVLMENPMYTMRSKVTYKLNESLDDSIFAPAK